MQYCSQNNQNGICCTNTDGRDSCNYTLNNCTSTPKFNITNNFAYLVCGFDPNVCGTSPSVVLPTDYEYDPRWGQNYVVAGGNPVVISTNAGLFLKNKRCTYVIRKSYQKVGLDFSITANQDVTVTYFKGGSHFIDLTSIAEVGQTTSAS